MAQEGRVKVRFVIELDNLDPNGTTSQILDYWLSAMTEDANRELESGEIISSSHWEYVVDSPHAVPKEEDPPGSGPFGF